MDLSLAAWSVNRRFRRDDKPMRIFSLPATARHEFGIDKLELVSTFLTRQDGGYLDELRACADGEGVALLNVAVDACGDLSDEDDGRRRTAVEQHSNWLWACERLGCTAMRANTGGSPGDTAGLERCIDSFGQLAARAKSHGVVMMVENHGGLSTDPAAIVRIITSVGDNIGSLPDFGNFVADILYDGLAAVMPYAVAVHAKSLRHIDPDTGVCWDERNGQRREIDLRRCVQIALDAGYTGPFGIEYGGGEADHEGVLLTRQVLESMG